MGTVWHSSFGATTALRARRMRLTSRSVSPRAISFRHSISRLLKPTGGSANPCFGAKLLTVHEYVENAKKKLKASTRTEAIAIAVSLAIVTPDGSSARIAIARPGPTWAEEGRTFSSRRQGGPKIEVGFLVPLVFVMNVVVAIVAWHVV